MSSNVTIAVVTCDDAALLGDCLASCGWADELIVFDMNSEDDSARIARESGATVIAIPRRPVVEEVRGLALEYVKTSWLFWVDPDERLPASYEQLIPQLVSSTTHVGFRLPFHEVAFGKPLLSVNSSARKLALLRLDAVTYDAASSVAHATPKIAGTVGDPTLEAIQHLSCRGVAQMLGKQLRYAESGGGVSTHEFNSPFFLLRLVSKELFYYSAWRDGSRGLAFSELISLGQHAAALRRWEVADKPEFRLTMRHRTVLAAGHICYVSIEKLAQANRILQRLRGQRR